jgi:hypothetical protein
MLSDGQTYDAVFIQLQSADDNPVPATSNVVVNLSSSSASAGTVESKTVIESGIDICNCQTYATTTPSKFKITASSTGIYNCINRDSDFSPASHNRQDIGTAKDCFI